MILMRVRLMMAVTMTVKETATEQHVTATKSLPVVTGSNNNNL